MFIWNHFIWSREAHCSVVHYSFNLFKGDSTGREVKLRTYDLSALAVFALVGGGHRAFNGFYHRGTADAPIFKLPEH